MPRTRDLARGAAFAGLVALALAACGGYQTQGADYGGQARPQQAQQPRQPAAPAQPDAVVVKLASSRFGPVLADAGGRTLYAFTKDVPGSGSSSCNGGCSATWPALTARGTPLAGGGVQAAKLGTIRRQDGGTQVTYNDWPLYRYGADTRPGQANGQGVGGVWFVVSSQGKLVRAAAGSTPAPSDGSSGGGYGGAGYADPYGG
jgi:predicted lipoprotein with Yx(FWY)xxD motif